MKRLCFSLLMVCLALMSFANIELTVDIDNYTFTGVNNANNYQFVLSPYEFKNGGPQFQLVVTPIDPNQEARFTGDDLQDQNYWEPMFKYYTKQLAGQEMTAQDNIKRLYLGDVALLPGQFVDYDELHMICFDLTKDNYILPDNCLLNAGQRLEEINVNYSGNGIILMDLMPNSLPSNKAYVVNVNTMELQEKWQWYKEEFKCQYTVNLLQEVGNAITGFTITVNMGSKDETMEIPASGMPEQDLSEGGEESDNVFIIKEYEAVTSGDIQSLQLMATIYEYGTSPKQWYDVPAQNAGGGLWRASGLDINVLRDLTEGKTYVLEMYVEATDGDGGKCYYNNGGQNYKVRFLVGNEQQPVTFYDKNTAGLGLRVNNNLVNFTLNGDGTKTPSGNLGVLNSLILEDFWVRCLRESGVELGDVSLQWRVLDTNKNVLYGWSRVDYQYQRDEDGDKHKKYFYANNLGIGLTEFCKMGNDYVLEVMYQLINANNGKYYFFGKDDEVGRFYFTYDQQGETLRGDLNGDKKVDVSDVNILINLILELPTEVQGNPDLDGDNKVDVSDVNEMINIILDL